MTTLVCTTISKIILVSIDCNYKFMLSIMNKEDKDENVNWW
jgi:hypothetical protein